MPLTLHPNIIQPHELVGRTVRWRPGGPADPAELGQVVAATPRQALVRFGDTFQWLKSVKLEPVS